MEQELGIIRQVLDGQVDSFRLLVERYQRPIISMISNILNDRHLGEDVAQEVFFTAYKKLSTFDPARSEFSTWLFTIARNKSINALKKKKAHPPGKPPEKINPANPYTEVMRREFWTLLDRCLETLPARQKVAFVLAELEDLSYKQIAQIEGVRLGTVKSRINRAKKKLRQILKNREADTK